MNWVIGRVPLFSNRKSFAVFATTPGISSSWSASPNRAMEYFMSFKNSLSANPSLRTNFFLSNSPKIRSLRSRSNVTHKLCNDERGASIGGGNFANCLFIRRLQRVISLIKSGILPSTLQCLGRLPSFNQFG